MYNLRFAKAEQTRKAITNQQLRQIKSMYQEIADQYSRKIENLSDKTNISSILRTQYLREYQKQLADELGKVNRRIESNIKSGMTQTAEAVLEEEIRRAKELGFTGITGKYSNIPTDVVETIISGQLYQGDWSLSSAIWGTNKKIQQDCQNIVARGIAQNKGVYEVAKDLEAYVNPSARKTYRWARDYPGSTKVIDYNASRLARTMMSHAYQEAFERSTEKDPWVEAYKWNTGHNNRVCQLCIEREENDSYGLGPGIYPKGEVPLDHPNGQCFLTIVQTKNTNDVVNDLANWYNGVGDQNMNEKINDFAYSLGYTPEMLKRKVKKVGVETAAEKIKQYSDRQIKNASKFIKELEMDQTSVDNYMDAIKGTSREFQNAFVDAMKKKVKNWDFDDEGSYYWSSMHEIKYTYESIEAWGFGGNNHQKQTLFHEIGHAIDDLRQGTNSKWTNKKEFVDAMLKDMNVMNDKCKNGDVEYILELKKMVNDDSSKGVQDAISAMHCKGINLSNVKPNVNVRWHHSQEYYERRDAKKEAASELFANMCGAQADKNAVKYIEKYFPNTYKEFWNIINEIGK